MSSPQENEGREFSFGIELEFIFYFQVREQQFDGAIGDQDEITIDPAEEATLPPALMLPPGIQYSADDGSDWGYSDLGDIDMGDSDMGDIDMGDIDIGDIDMGDSDMGDPDLGDPDLGDSDPGGSGSGRPGSARRWAVKLIKKAIMSVPGARMQGCQTDLPRPFQSMYLIHDCNDAGSGWEVKNDISVRDTELRLRGYGKLGFEITSPALLDRPESHRHVHQVIKELISRFRVRVNVRTGFHCHVGAGRWPVGDASDWESTTKESEGLLDDDYAESKVRGEHPKHSLRVFKRAAALMWAADGFLCHAHPPERGLNIYSPPIRFCSRLAHGVWEQVIYTEDGCRESHETPLEKLSPDAGAEGGHFSKPKLPSHKIPRLHGGKFFPALRPMDIDDESRRRFDTMAGAAPIQRDAAKLENTTVYSGVRHIMRCATRASVGKLFCPPGRIPLFHRMGYNLKGSLDDAIVAIDSGTVEFREATGTMCPDWIYVWSNICLGFFRFARDASDARFWAVIGELAEAEAAAWDEQQHHYDMVSLLFDMGLVAEGLYLEQKLSQNPLGFWYPNRLFGIEECEFF